MTTVRLIALVCIFACCSGSGVASGSSGSAYEHIGDGVRIIQVPKKLKIICNTTHTDGTFFDVYWYKGVAQLDDSDKRISIASLESKNVLTIDPTKEEDMGEYSCDSSSPDPANGIPVAAQVFDVVALTYSKLPSSTVATVGEKLVLTCVVKGDPTPELTWKKENITLVPDDRVTFTSMNDNLPNSTLEIDDVQYDDHGKYGCFFSNHDEINISNVTNVKVKDMYAALWPFLGIVIEVVLLCAIIFFYEKHRTKNDFEESDTDQGNQKPSR